MSGQNNNDNNNSTNNGNENPTLIDSAKQMVGQAADATKQVAQGIYEGIAGPEKPKTTKDQTKEAVVDSVRAGKEAVADTVDTGKEAAQSLTDATKAAMSDAQKDGDSGDREG